MFWSKSSWNRSSAHLTHRRNEGMGSQISRSRSVDSRSRRTVSSLLCDRRSSSTRSAVASSARAILESRSFSRSGWG